MDARRRMFETLRDELAAGGPPRRAVLRVPAERYLDAARCAREQAVFARRPRIALASSELAPGACVPAGDALVTRDRDGTVRAFANACRHRGTRLADAPCAKAIVCPYHAWTYDLRGRLIHVPHEATFGDATRDRDLRPLPVVERAGLVWIGALDPAWLAPIEPELAALDLASHVVWKRATLERRCNWKLVIEAFLDGYHIRTLHRATVYRFFLDAASVAEPAGEHIRAVTARRTLAEATDLEGDLRQLGTPSFFVFPATTIIEHPDFVSVITVTPRAPDVTAWEHTMLVPAARAAEAAHWDRSWDLIEGGVFQREDLWVCEQVQRGLAANPGDDLLFGDLEFAARFFHEALAAALASMERGLSVGV